MVQRASFQIERVKGSFKFPVTNITSTDRIVYGPDGKERRIPQRNYEFGYRDADEAFMVYFPQGHSICLDVNDKAALERYGLTKEAEAADFSELIPSDDAANLPKTPKQIVAARMNKYEVRARATGGLSNVDTM